MPSHWDMARLTQAPKTYPAPDYAAESTDSGAESRFSGEGVKPIFYEGLPWKGKPTRVFAWYGIPDHKANEKVPAMVLAHGGGGTAFDEWVRIWNRRGYAAISMDLCGTRSGGEPGGRPPHEWGGPGNGGDSVDWPTEDQWVYHAVADIVLANSLLRSFPEIDPDRIGLTGISWGGFLTCIASAVDDRFQFGAPVYGCGFIGDGPWQDRWENMGKERAGKWLSLWDPSNYLAHVCIPTFWIVGSNDFAFPLDIHSRSYNLCGGEKSLSVKVGMNHSHVHGWEPEEIYVYADAMAKGGVAMARFTEQGREGANAWARYDADAPIKRAEFIHTTDTSDWKSSEWKTAQADLDAESHIIRATIPEDCAAYFFNLVDERDLVASSVVVER